MSDLFSRKIFVFLLRLEDLKNFELKDKKRWENKILIAKDFNREICWTYQCQSITV